MSADEKYVLGLILHRPESYKGSIEAVEPRVVLIDAQTGKELKKVGISKISEISNPQKVQFTSDTIFYVADGKSHEFFQVSDL